MYREEETGGSFMLGVLTGALVGAGVALLFAPRAGNEIRAQLGEQYRGIADRVGQQTENLRSAAGQWRENRQRRDQLSDRMSSSTDRETSSTMSDADRFPSSAPSV